MTSADNAPSLFLIAKALDRMQVWASVNEADIRRIHQGTDARFTVDAFPNEVFLGKVIQTRLNATMTQNAVTYTVVISFENPDLKLLPYLTANVQFQVGSRKRAPGARDGAAMAAPAGADRAGCSPIGRGCRGSKESLPPVGERPGRATCAAGCRSNRPQRWNHDRG